MRRSTRLRWADRILSDGIVWQLRADHEQKQDFGDRTVTQGLDTQRPITEALQLRLLGISDPLRDHDSEIMDGGWVD